MQERASDTIAVQLVAVSKRFGAAGETAAVDGLDVEIRDGEFFSLLGPSGSGKTTTLRMIAGFERPTSGTIRLYGRDVTRLPPNERDVNTVFQDYALFPHMSVAQNIAYGLEVRRVPVGQAATLTWTTTGASTVSISPTVGTVAGSGSRVGPAGAGVP